MEEAISKGRRKQIEVIDESLREGETQDMSLRKRAEEALRDSEAKYRTLVEQIPAITYITACDNPSVAIYVSPKIEDLLGYDPENFMKNSNSWLEHLYPEDHEKILADVDRLSKAKEPIVLEYRMVSRDGRVKWFRDEAQLVRDESGEPLFYQGVMFDITERKQIEEALCESEKRYRTLFELSVALNYINKAINSTLDFDQIMRRVVIESTTAIGSEAAAIIMHEGDRWVARYTSGLPRGMAGMRFTSDEAGALVLAARIRRPVAVNDTSHDKRVNCKEMEKYGIRSFLSVPLIVKSGVIGALSFYYRSNPIKFDEVQIDFATKLATSISLALENVHLYEAEHKIADTLQEALLIMPDRTEGVDYGYLYRSATEAAKVGGDFYDIFEIEHGKVGVVIGDVSGKGIEATALTSLVKNTIKAHAYEGGTPALIMSKTNDLVLKNSSPSIFVTVFFGVLDTATGKLTYCNAGHPPVIVKRVNSGVELLGRHSPVVGAFPKMHYRSGKAKLEHGDILVLYTDGITEARCDGGFYGEDRLVEFIKGLKSVRVKELPKLIFDDVMYRAGGRLSDDIALLAVLF